MKNTFLLFVALLLVLRVSAQTEDYKKFIAEAEKFVDVKQYQQAGETYSKAFAALGGKGFPNDRYNAACAWALAGNNDSAFFQLNKLATKGNFTDYNHLIIDEDLKGLYNDKRWAEVCAIVKANKDKAEANLDKRLVGMLDTIFTNDQDGRMQIDKVQQQYGNNSPEMKALWVSINEKDSIDLIKVRQIVDKYGWPGPDVAGVQGSQTVFLVIQHADIATQEHYLPMMREAVKNKKAQPSALALLEDRVALREGRKQIYGSQVRSDKDGNTWLSPLEDPDNVDKRRAEVGLQPLAEYLQNWNIKWDVEEYKKQLPGIEKKEKDNP